MASRGWMILVMSMGCGPEASPSPGDGNGGTDTGASATEGAVTDASATNASVTGASATNATTDGPSTSPTDTTAESTGDLTSNDVDDSFGENECDASFDDCPAGFVCCGGAFEPYVCNEVPPGYCGGTVGCEPGFECGGPGPHCAIAECYPTPDETSSSTDGTTTDNTTTDGTTTSESSTSE